MCKLCIDNYDLSHDVLFEDILSLSQRPQRNSEPEYLLIEVQFLAEIGKDRYTGAEFPNLSKMEILFPGRFYLTSLKFSFCLWRKIQTWLRKNYTAIKKLVTYYKFDCFLKLRLRFL